jgi:sulfur-carrier protein
VTLLYFAWVRQKIGKSEEAMAMPPAVSDVAGLVAHLKSLSGGHAEAFADLSRIRVAVNQRHGSFEAALREGDEVAFFPPVTGG